MVACRFLSNATLWAEIQKRARRAKRAAVAVAYLGQGGSKLLPLRRGSRLVVDMSLPTVKARATDPREIKRLIRKSVQVFSHRGLHAKLFAFDGFVIVGSANVSRNSREALDEAAILTSDPAVVRRAGDFIERLCTEPVRPEYLKQCIAAYEQSPIRAGGQAPRRGIKRRQIAEANLWFIGGLRNFEVRDSEKAMTRAIEKAAGRKLKRPAETEVTWTRFGPHRVPKFISAIRDGDWVVDCCLDRESGRRHVGPPEQFLGIEEGSNEGGRRLVFVTKESPRAGETMPLPKFRRRVGRFLPELDRESPKTRPIPDSANADSILRMWTHAGKVARRRRRR